MKALRLGGFLGALALPVGSLAAANAQPSYHWRQEDLSALAAGNAQHPWIMMTAILIFAAGVAALTRRFRTAVLISVPSRAGVILLMLLAGASAAAAVLRNDCSTERPSCAARASFSWHHYAHDVCGVLTMLLLVAVPLVVAESFHADPRWKSLVWPSRVAGWLGAIGLVLYLLTDSSGTQDQGLLQRASMAPFLLWLALAQWSLSRTASTAPVAIVRRRVPA